MIYKVFREAEYADFMENGETHGAPVDIQDGYIHFSTLDQLPGTLAKHFQGESPLYLLALDDRTLGEALKWEPSRGGALFPHLYRVLREGDVLKTHQILDHQLPEGLE